MSIKKHALLFDVSSIQRYIFESNRLALNVGASYIIENNLFNKDRFKALGFDNIQPAYTGGGICLFLFDEKDQRDIFEVTFKKKVRKTFPGLKLISAQSDDFDVSHAGYRSSMSKIHGQLKSFKNFNHTEVSLPKSGIATSCVLTGEMALADKTSNKKHISREAEYKLDYASISSEKYYNNQYADILLKKWQFTNEIDQLGQPAEKSYIAVVHLDGNGIGNKFIHATSLEYTQGLSEAIKSLSRTVMKKLIAEVVQISQEIADKQKEITNDDLSLKDGRKKWNAEMIKSFNFSYDHSDKKYFLPIRPIIAGGDDFTFVCEGKLGLYLAEKLVEYIEEYEFDEKFGLKDNRITACAGVAIVPTKFPFFKAVNFAEELCQIAKKSCAGQSYLSFLTYKRNTSKNLIELINTQYRLDNGELLHTAYRLASSDDMSKGDEYEDDYTINDLKNQLIEYHHEESWSMGRIMELRELLYTTDTNISHENMDYFVAKYNARKKNTQNVDLRITKENRILYHDAIELYDFYPQFLMCKTETDEKVES